MKTETRYSNIAQIGPVPVLFLGTASVATGDILTTTSATINKGYNDPRAVSDKLVGSAAITLTSTSVIRPNWAHALFTWSRGLAAGICILLLGGCAVLNNPHQSNPYGTTYPGLSSGEYASGSDYYWYWETERLRREHNEDQIRRAQSDAIRAMRDAAINVPTPIPPRP